MTEIFPTTKKCESSYELQQKNSSKKTKDQRKGGAKVVNSRVFQTFFKKMNQFQITYDLNAFYYIQTCD